MSDYTPTDQAQEQADLAASQHDAATTATAREPGKNSRGEPTMYPSDIEGYQTQYGLTATEAETLWTRSVRDGEDAQTVVDELKGARVVYRQTYEQIPATANALSGIDARAAENARLAVEAENQSEAAADPTQPEAGPYGPHADYREATVTAEEVAQQTGAPVDVAAEALGTGTDA